jgi:selenide,water dikinase
MRSKAKGRWIDAALQTMVLSNQQAAECLQQYGATACTDLTGFGLLGHLVEMTRASAVDATLFMDQLPLLDGARETVAAGILSSLQPQNLRLRRALQDMENASRHPLYPLLFDPQTAGGLLAGVPQDQAQTCLSALQQIGYADSAVIGVIEPQTDELAPIRLQ